MKPLGLSSLAAVLSSLLAFHALQLPEGTGQSSIPAFARQFRTACSTCHTAAPKLNVLGEVFRLNGYRMPESDLLIRRDDPIPLGDDEWREEWPRAIWPGELPGRAPIALRIQLDAALRESEQTQSNFTYEFPGEIYLLAGTNLGGSISTFLEAEWTPDENIEVKQAKLLFQDPIRQLPDRLLNVWIGLQNPYLFTLADRQIDRAGRLKFSWQEFAPSDLLVTDATGTALTSNNTFELGITQPSIQVTGLVGRRFFYGVGLGQGAGGLVSDNNDHKDLYYQVRYKLGGLDLRGSYDPGGGPVTGGGGQLLDRTIILEHFGYFGAEPVAGGRQGDHRSFGVNARVLEGRWDVGLGWVHSDYDTPWGTQLAADLSVSSIFGKAEWLGFPWLIGSFKFESFSADSEALSPLDETQVRIVPGLIMLIRQNIRGVIEAELFAEEGDVQNQQNGLFMRLDVAF